MRVMLIGVAVAACVWIAATLVGRAVDQVVQEHTLIVRNGITLDCQRVVRDGLVYYENCNRVP